MNNNLLILSAIAIMTALPAQAQVPSRTPIDSCDRMSSFFILPNGRCQNLSYLSATRGDLIPKNEEKIVDLFVGMLAKIHVPISHQDCPTGYLGYYDPVSNNMVMCTMASENPYHYYKTTLVHESIHAVQDFLDGSKNETLVTIGSKYPKLGKEVEKGLKTPKRKQIEKLYQNKKDHWPYEFEAWYFMQYPDKVVQIINLCAANPTCR